MMSCPLKDLQHPVFGIIFCELHLTSSVYFESSLHWPRTSAAILPLLDNLSQYLGWE